MIKTKLSWTMNNIRKMAIDKNVLSFDHPIQRKSGMWSSSQKSLLLHSMLANYPVPNIYVLREEKEKSNYFYFVMDGKQRLTSVLSFMDGEFPLDDNIPNIFIDEEEYEIAGKYFCDLDEVVQHEISRYKFDIFAFEDVSNEEVEEIFFRLNNSTALTKSQVAKAKMGVKRGVLVNELLQSKFFTVSANFSKSQLKASDDQRCLIQSMMLLDANYVKDFEFKDFSENSIMEYSQSIHDTFTDKQANTLTSAIEYLTNAFPEKNKEIRKISIPMLVYMADVAMDKEIKPIHFREWFNYFSSEDEAYDTYKLYGSSGSTKKEKVLGRLCIMCQCFCTYFETDIPEELKELIEERFALEKGEEEKASGESQEENASGEESQEETQEEKQEEGQEENPEESPEENPEDKEFLSLEANADEEGKEEQSIM